MLRVFFWWFDRKDWVVSYSKVVEELKDELLSVLGILQTMETTGPSMYEVIAPVPIVLCCKNYKCP